MKGISFLVDDAGRRTAVVIDLELHEELWEDVYDALVSDERRDEPTESLDEVKERLIRQGAPDPGA